MELSNIKYIVMDVDGTLTDSGLYYDDTGNEFKKFSTKDGTGLVAARYNKMVLVVITGRECAATTRRMKELGVDYIFQNIRDKSECLNLFMRENSIDKEQIAYIGDDLNDLECMSLCGFVGCPWDSCYEVKDRADYISSICGGHGAVRDVIEHILRSSGKWEETISHMYSKINPYVKDIGI